MTVSPILAAADKGMNRAATRARDAAYFGRKFYEPLLDNVKNKLPDIVNKHLDKDKRLTSYGEEIYANKKDILEALK